MLSNNEISSHNPSILVVQHREERFWYLDYALNQLGILHNTVRIDQFETINLTAYNIILVGSFIGILNEVKPCLDAKASEIESWVVSGGSLVIFSQFVGGALYDLNWNLVPTPGFGYFSWAPSNPSFVSWASDSAHIVNTNHPITQSLADEDLSGWYTSPDGYFSSFPDKHWFFMEVRWIEWQYSFTNLGSAIS